MSLASHDRSLKYLLAQEPADFIRFALRPASVRVLRPVESDLPARDRTVDGGYLIERDDRHEVAHVEFYRRHEDLTELGLDIGEAQIRIHRRERVPVTTFLWDLYGSRKAEVLSDRVVWLGPEDGAGSSRLMYRRVNLRGFIVSDFAQHWPGALRQMGEWIRSGKLKYRETVAQGLAAAPEAFLGLLKGKNFGKQVVKLV